MSRDTPDGAITTEAEFESALQTLLLVALENGLDLRGAWEYRNGEAYPDLEVLVSELAKERVEHSGTNGRFSVTNDANVLRDELLGYQAQSSSGGTTSIRTRRAIDGT